MNTEPTFYWPDCVLKLAKAIANAEGFGDPDAIPTKGNNPGDLTGSDGGSFRTLGTMNPEGVLHFENLEDGWQALYIKLNRLLSGKSTVYPLTMTLQEMGRKYSGEDNDNWATNVGEFLGVPITTTIQELADG